MAFNISYITSFEMTEIFYISFLIVTLYTVFKTNGKVESDRFEALQLSRENMIKGTKHTHTSQGNPITTGIFSVLLSLTFKDLRFLSALFWVWVFVSLYLNSISPIVIYLLMPFILRTALYRLEEVYYIMIPYYYGVLFFGAWGIIALLFWRRFGASRKVLMNKKLNKSALCLDYILLIIIFLL